jgi:hypothetical protein
VVGFRRGLWRVKVIGDRLDDKRTRMIATTWLRRWRELRRFKRGEGDLTFSGPWEEIVRARHGEALFVELDTAEAPYPIPLVSDVAKLATASLPVWGEFISHYGLPIVHFEGKEYADSYISPFGGRIVYRRRGEPALLRVRLRDLQPFGWKAGLLQLSLDTLRGQSYPLKQLLRRAPESILRLYLLPSGALPSVEEEIAKFAYRLVEALRRDAKAELLYHGFVDTVQKYDTDNSTWDMCVPGWWSLMVVTTTQGIQYREPRVCVAAGCDRLLPLGRDRYCSDACYVNAKAERYVAKRKAKKQ